MYRIHFYPRDAMLARVLANVAMALRLSVCLSVASWSVLSKRMNESSWFSVWELTSTHPTLC